jgi:hypothetical protein
MSFFEIYGIGYIGNIIMIILVILGSKIKKYFIWINESGKLNNILNFLGMRSSTNL